MCVERRSGACFIMGRQAGERISCQALISHKKDMLWLRKRDEPGDFSRSDTNNSTGRIGRGRLPRSPESKPQPNGRFGWGPGYRALSSGKIKAPPDSLRQKTIRFKTKQTALDLERSLISGRPATGPQIRLRVHEHELGFGSVDVFASRSSTLLFVDAFRPRWLHWKGGVSASSSRSFPAARKTRARTTPSNAAIAPILAISAATCLISRT